MRRFWKIEQESNHFKILKTKLEEKRKAVIGEIGEKHKDALTWAERKGIKIDDVVSQNGLEV